MTEKQKVTDSNVTKTLQDVEREAIRKKRTEKVKLPVRDFIEKVTALIRSTRMDPVEIKMLYAAITSKMEAKTCYRCLKIKPVIEGEYQLQDDLSKPKRFVCGDCK